MGVVVMRKRLTHSESFLVGRKIQRPEIEEENGEALRE